MKRRSFKRSCRGFVFQIEPLSGLLDGGTMVTISGSNLGQKAEDILQSVSVAGVPCTVIPDLYEVSSRYTPAHILFIFPIIGLFY